MQRTLGLRAPKMLVRDFDWAESVFFGAGLHESRLRNNETILPGRIRQEQ
ncbi:hypothetical protein D560_1004 [Bordetella holmesii ATCC 51541]|nr:hypothetical protein D560_1004 [Bordetella holmesii ATCC 51541]